MDKPFDSIPLELLQDNTATPPLELQVFTYLVPTMPTNCSAQKIRTVTRIPTGAPTTGYGGFETQQKQYGIEASAGELLEILQYFYTELKRWYRL